MTRDVAHALDALAACAVRITGFSPDAVQPAALQRFLARSMAGGTSAGEIAERALADDPALVRALAENVTVGETYFFRHPEQFDRVVTDVLEPFDWQKPFRAWSAGCATGEEAWSIAACLNSVAPKEADWLVEGSDILARNVRTAEAGLYGSWSVRRLTPLRFNALEPLADGRYRVIDELRPRTRFHVGNLLDASAKTAAFDLIFCRNVLVYFSDDTRQEAVARLRDALAPDGVLFFGAMDVDGTPPGLVRAGPAELQMYARADSPRWRTRTPVPPVRTSRPPPVRPPPAVPRVTPEPRPPAPVVRTARPRVPVPPKAPPELVRATEPLVLHLEALLLMEKGADRDAARVLDELVVESPGYVAGLLERALMYQRQNALEAATSLMRRVLNLAKQRPPDEELPGPEPLPARFYAESASAFLSRREGGSR